MDVKKRMDEYTGNINVAMEKFLPKPEGPQKSVIEAMRYSALASSKRIRPMLMLEFARVCGGDADAVMPVACAEEMIHTYSLIHDDLPCMDNDDMRRGRPSCHVKFGEATAMLAGDALLSLAFETALCDNIRTIKPVDLISAVHLLAEASGYSGMVGGQVMDLESEGHDTDISVLECMHRKKTGAMIVAAAKMGCILAGADDAKIEAAGAFASNIGLAFQIVDDCLDVSGNSKALGKLAGSDAENNKSTYVTHLGLKKAKELAKKLTDEAVQSLIAFDDKDFLSGLAVFLCSRDR